ncbi:mandelate racemase/muconate lactonizing enzyme family protein [Rhodovarius crocodyli]|uniref:Mandelate racemase/muconate lactonizing enzyme family protein n=1 Tax=Rhodovarius crocodyli TaxID=1979269 RepID=A0A437MMG9_9PROT|nr:mandelate racemase/muconate lactonizing enzyme family protein [Rhodovarius crocodyli]RVT98844.1 mandelate racemase/muconate lactonizing enzyme family protein [Rhodovarius crocodyli]
MKITNVSVYRAPMTAMKEGAAHAVLLVRIETDEGISGAGEIGLAYGAGGSGAAQIVLELARAHVIGRDPMRTEAIFDAMRRKTFWGHVPGPIFGAAVSAIDEALWDIKGKAMSQPVHVLLGGACRDELRLYCNGWYRSRTTPEAYAEAARDVVARGFDAMKFDPMKLDAAGKSAHPNRRLERPLENLAAARVEAVREAVGPDIDILVELHGNIWPMDAIRFGKRIAHTNPLFMEEVADAEDAEAARQVAEGCGLAIAGGERLCTPIEFRRFFELRALSVAQPDMGIAGGFTGVRAIAALAAAHGVYIQPHNCGGPISTAACLHLSFSITNFLIQEIFPVWPEDDRLDLVDAPYEKQVRNGRMPLPSRPGLGVELNMDYLKRLDCLTAV